MMRLTYYIQRGKKSYTIPLLVKDVCLHLDWRAPLPGDRYEFEGPTSRI